MHMKLSFDDLGTVTGELKVLYSSFSDFFRNKTRRSLKQALQYLQGQVLLNERRNMTNIEKVVPDCNHQSLQHFISNSRWDEEGVINELQRQVSELIGNPIHGSVHIDESGFPKDGENSVGVKRQHCGRLGKVDNCQVGVFLGYAFWNRRTLIDKRLYLPDDWANDPVRRERCGVPPEITFKTKAELGLEMLLKARERRLPLYRRRSQRHESMAGRPKSRNPEEKGRARSPSHTEAAYRGRARAARSAEDHRRAP